jgi:hypothetical protein
MAPIYAVITTKVVAAGMHGPAAQRVWRSGVDALTTRSGAPATLLPTY